MAYYSVQSLSCVQLFETPCQASLSITDSRSLSIELVIPYNHLLLCRPRLLPLSIFLSIRVFSRSQFPGLISFRMDWFDLLAVQGNLKSLLQHHRSKASILWCSAFFIVQLLHPYMATGKTIALIRWTFVGRCLSFEICCLDLSKLSFQGARRF